MPTEHFGSGQFKSELWIRQKKVFPNLERVDIEFGGAPFDWIIADPNGKEVKSVHVSSIGGWTSIHLPSLGLYGDFSVGLRNTSGKTILIKQGDVKYGT